MKNPLLYIFLIGILIDICKSKLPKGLKISLIPPNQKETVVVYSGTILTK
jgi:hypothetical protein